MALTLTTPVSIVNAITTIAKWQIIDYDDHDTLAIPVVNVLVQAYKGTTVYGAYWLVACDSQPSLCLYVNPSSATLTDQLVVGWRTLTNAYTLITNAYDSATGNAKAKKVATELSLLTCGLVDAALVGI